MLNKPLVAVAGVIILLSTIAAPSLVNATHLTTLWCRSVLRGSAFPGPTAPFCDLLGLGEITNIPTTSNTAACPTNYVRISAFQCTHISSVITPRTLPPSNYHSPPRILSHSAYTDNAGTLHIVGEVMNQSPVMALSVKVTVTFYNSYNQVIGTDYTYTSPSNIIPGQRASFGLMELSGSIPMSQVRTYALTVSTS